MTLALAIVLLGLGLAFILAEVLFPSLGMLTLLASLCILGAIAVAFGISPSTGVNFLIAVALLVPTAILTGLKLLPHSPLGKKLVASGLSFASSRATDVRDLDLEGAEGTVESPLRPAGMARIAGRRVDVVSRGEMIEAGAHVRVVEVRGNRVVVARADQDRSAEGGGGRAAAPQPPSGAPSQASGPPPAGAGPAAPEGGEPAPIPQQENRP